MRNFRRIGNDFRLYSEHGVKAVFCRGSACTGGQFEHLRRYVQAKLIWDPGLNVEKLTGEWVEGVLGKSAGGPVLEYLLLTAFDEIFFAESDWDLSQANELLDEYVTFLRQGLAAPVR